MEEVLEEEQKGLPTRGVAGVRDDDHAGRVGGGEGGLEPVQVRVPRGGVASPNHHILGPAGQLQRHHVVEVVRREEDAGVLRVQHRQHDVGECLVGA